jgi:CBS domain-containing protein
MPLERFCRKSVVTCPPGEVVSKTAEKMKMGHVGAVVVVDAKHAPIGILTDRDVACGVVAAHLNPDSTPVSEVMSGPVETLPMTASLDVALFAMREHGVRRLPIVDDEGAVRGLVSLDDLLVLLSAELNQTAKAVRSNRGP